MRDHFGNMCDRVGQDARAGGMMMCRDFHRGLIPEIRDKGTERRQQCKNQQIMIWNEEASQGGNSCNSVYPPTHTACLHPHCEVK